MSRVGAFFDLDHTLIHCNSGARWLRFLRARGEISFLGMLQATGWLLRYKLAILDMESVAGKALRSINGQLESDMVDKANDFTTTHILPTVAPLGEAAVAQHRSKGHVLAILSSSTPYVAEPLARHFGIDNILCTRLNVKGGRFDGTHIAPACYGEGKVYWAERFARAHDIDLAKSFFYTDSYSDMPMLLAVGERRVINPDARLFREARRRSWPIANW